MLLFKNAQGLYGFMDTAGNTIVQAQYTAASAFRKDGYAAVQMDEKWGLIDKTGTLVLDTKFEDIR
jgi:hypothetical protein